VLWLMRLPTGVARRAAAVTACVAAAGLAAPIAHADDRGAGLYEPFTGAASTKAAKRYVDRLAEGRLPFGRRLRASFAGLRAGVFVNDGRPVPATDTPGPGAATTRAERTADIDGPLSAGLGIAALALGLCAAGAASRLRS
jgi:hypothetical protein